MNWRVGLRRLAIVAAVAYWLAAGTAIVFAGVNAPTREDPGLVITIPTGHRFVVFNETRDAAEAIVAAAVREHPERYSGDLNCDEDTATNWRCGVIALPQVNPDVRQVTDWSEVAKAVSITFGVSLAIFAVISGLIAVAIWIVRGFTHRAA